ncbi:hypothetical protein PR002_g17189 [Phytophthora rubi]|uniref:SET domain-containing protein n=1 Tax=Phytophthora rubi TaxID=129364 RepID=A0A6A3KA27_9STRA|nr:hypothetical protein PR002_g17189 [Phytophthora rubi]
MGSVIGNHSGELTTHDFEADEVQTSEYALELQTKSTIKKIVYIDAAKCGGIARYINHPCRPNTEFVMFRKTDVLVLVIATKKITAGDAVTVDYGPDL